MAGLAGALHFFQELVFHFVEDRQQEGLGGQVLAQVFYGVPADAVYGALYFFFPQRERCLAAFGHQHRKYGLQVSAKNSLVALELDAHATNLLEIAIAVNFPPGY